MHRAYGLEATASWRLSAWGLRPWRTGSKPNRLRAPLAPGASPSALTVVGDTIATGMSLIGVQTRSMSAVVSDIIVLSASTCGWSTTLRVLILYANPAAASFGATLHRRVVTSLRSGGHEIDDCDLYAESFNSVMGEQERVQYHNVELNRAPIGAYADRLLAAEALGEF